MLAKRWLRNAYPGAFAPTYMLKELGDGRTETVQMRQPLALGIAQTLLNDPLRPNRVSKTAVRAALAEWTRHDVYLIALTVTGAARINAYGEDVGQVSPKHRKKAYAMLGQRRAARQAKRVTRLPRSHAQLDPAPGYLVHSRSSRTRQFA